MKSVSYQTSKLLKMLLRGETNSFFVALDILIFNFFDIKRGYKIKI